MNNFSKKFLEFVSIFIAVYLSYILFAFYREYIGIEKDLGVTNEIFIFLFISFFQSIIVFLYFQIFFRIFNKKYIGFFQIFSIILLTTLLIITISADNLLLILTIYPFIIFIYFFVSSNIGK